MKKMAALALLASSSILAMACGGGGDDDKSASDVGHCTTKTECFEVTSPDDYDLRFDCSIAGGTPGEGACDASEYDTKCTQVTEVSENDGPAMEVTYVYYRAADTDVFCAGEEEDL